MCLHPSGPSTIPHSDPRLIPVPPSLYPFHPLPLPTSPSAIVTVHLLSSSRLSCKKEIMAEAKNPDEMLDVPCLAFLVEKNGQRFMWDLGLMENTKNATPKTLNSLFKEYVPTFQPSPLSKLPRSGIEPSTISTVFLSHQHFDHFGDLDDIPSDVPIFLGPGTLGSIEKGYPEDEESVWQQKWLDDKMLIELPSVEYVGEWRGGELGQRGSTKGRRWERMGCFEKAMDWFGDGSFWLIDAPGHCTGHIMALARVTYDPPTYVLLAGDAAHHQELYLPAPTDEHPQDHRTAVPYVSGEPAIDTDPVAATWTIGQVTRMSAEDNVMVLLAHEGEAEGVIPQWPSEGGLRDWKQRGWKEKKEEGVKKRAGWL